MAFWPLMIYEEKEVVDAMKFWLSLEESARLRQILHVLFNHHLGAVISQLRLRKKLPLKKKIKNARFKERELTPELVRIVIEDLDGSFIKLGQLLALRPDLIPIPYCEELSKLQDKVKPFPGNKAVEIIEKEFGKPVKRLFKSFDETPIAAASMGQVHSAVLKDGTKVAVKVQRPDIYRTVKIDIKLLYRFARLVSKRYGTGIINPAEIVQEFERYTEIELNYLKEAHNIDLFYHNFEKSKALLVPKVFWSHTTSRVLTMEYIAGKRLTDISKFKPAQRKRIVDTILNAEFEQIFRHGLFHADPHPGNYLIKRNGKIALLDFGIIGRLDYVMKEHMTDFFVSLVNADTEGLIDAALKLGITTQESDVETIRRDLYDYLAPFHDTPLDKIRIADLLHNIIKILRENHLRISPNFVLLVKATVTLEGLAQRLDPKLNFIASAKPFVKKLVRERMHPRRIAERAKRKIETMMEFAGSIPRKTDALLTELHDTTRDLHRIDTDISSLTRELDKSSNRVTLGFLAGTLFVASTILVPFQPQSTLGMPVLSFIGYVAAFVITISIFLSIMREKKI